MPFRSPKMYSFIFGFQRLVWWPKCTPASSRSFIAIPAKQPSMQPGLCRARTIGLTFTELEALARSGHAVLLAFLRARIAREHAFVLQPLAQFEVVLDERAGDAEANRAGLAGHAAAGDRREDVELVGGFRDE